MNEFFNIYKRYISSGGDESYHIYSELIDFIINLKNEDEDIEKFITTCEDCWILYIEYFFKFKKRITEAEVHLKTYNYNYAKLISSRIYSYEKIMFKSTIFSMYHYLQFCLKFNHE